MGVMRLRLRLKKLRVELLEYDGKHLNLLFHSSTRISPDLIRQLVTQQPDKYRLGADYKLAVTLGRIKAQELLDRVRKELQQFF